MAAVFVAMMFLSLIIVDLGVHKWGQSRALATVHRLESYSGGVSMLGLDALCRLPDGVRLSKDHTWARLYPAGGLELGADTLLATAVGPIQQIVLPKVGDQVEAGGSLFRVEHNGRGMTIPSAVSGRVLAANSRLLEEPELLSSDPYGAGWVCYLGPTEGGPAPSASSSGKTAAWLESEFGRFAEFIFMHVSPDLAVGTTSQDGGLPNRGCLSELDQKAWSAFEAEFLRRG